MNTKKNILKISLIYVVYVLLLFLISGNCHSNWCEIREDGFFGIVLLGFAPLLPLFFLSLITYRMKDEVFRAWFHFAAWFVPIIIAATFLLQHVGGGGGWGISSGIFEFVVLWLLYIILIVVSLIQITRAYLKTKLEEKKLSPAQVKNWKIFFSFLLMAIFALFILWWVTY